MRFSGISFGAAFRTYSKTQALAISLGTLSSLRSGFYRLAFALIENSSVASHVTQQEKVHSH